MYSFQPLSTYVDGRLVEKSEALCTKLCLAHLWSESLQFWNILGCGLYLKIQACRVQYTIDNISSVNVPPNKIHVPNVRCTNKTCKTLCMYKQVRTSLEETGAWEKVLIATVLFLDFHLPLRTVANPPSPIKLSISKSLYSIAAILNDGLAQLQTSFCAESTVPLSANLSVACSRRGRG